MKTIGKIAIIIFLIYCFAPNLVINGYNKLKYELSIIDIEVSIKGKNSKMSNNKEKSSLNLPKKEKEDVGLILPNSNSIILK